MIASIEWLINHSRCVVKGKGHSHIAYVVKGIFKSPEPEFKNYVSKMPQKNAMERAF